MVSPVQDQQIDSSRNLASPRLATSTCPLIRHLAPPTECTANRHHFRTKNRHTEPVLANRIRLHRVANCIRTLIPIPQAIQT